MRSSQYMRCFEIHRCLNNYQIFHPLDKLAINFCVVLSSQVEMHCETLLKNGSSMVSYNNPRLSIFAIVPYSV